MAFNVGDYVEKFSGDAQYKGTIVSCYQTLNGKTRYVVDVDPQNFQMITAAQFIRKVEVGSSQT